jgi:hypothetical protein
MRIRLIDVGSQRALAPAKNFRHNRERLYPNLFILFFAPHCRPNSPRSDPRSLRQSPIAFHPKRYTRIYLFLFFALFTPARTSPRSNHPPFADFPIAFQ